MMRGIHELSSSLHPARNAPYNLALATLASSSSSSSSSYPLWSDVSSQHSDDTVSTAPTSESGSFDSYFSSNPPISSQTSVSSLGSSCEPAIKLHDPWARQRIQSQAHVELPAELRQNPRRTCNSAISRTGRPPSLVRQTDRKVSFVDNLVETSTHIVEAIWPTSSVLYRNDSGNSAVLPLRKFIEETLRRSRTSYSTLQVALYYLILIKPHVPAYDFTAEQPNDCHSSQAIQCGRRMFLAALILASKYLQDRNYSARAWSKISGLNVLEINKNEMVFLLAVNWNLHVTEEVYKRWADCVSSLTPTQPPSPGGAAQQLYERQCYDFRRIILNLSPDLDNLEELAPWSTSTSHVPDLPARSLYTPPAERACGFMSDGEFGSASKLHGLPAVMEPAPSVTCAPRRFAPALGLLPTPRLTPQTIGYNTPAASTVPSVLKRSSSMGFAVAQAAASMAAQSVDRWPPSATSSPMSYVTRRSSLANSISSASSPESMVSDSSVVSRSSSISSASSVTAPSCKLDVRARYRYGKLCSDRLSLKPTIASVPEDHEAACLTSSPESYGVAPSKGFCDVVDTPLASREREMNDAAQALQDLQRYGASRSAVQVKTGIKRSRALSTEKALQDDVREMLADQYPGNGSWPETMVRSQQSSQALAWNGNGSRHKRVCCSTEAALPHLRIPSLHPAVGGYGGPGINFTVFILLIPHISDILGITGGHPCDISDLPDPNHWPCSRLAHARLKWRPRPRASKLCYVLSRLGSPPPRHSVIDYDAHASNTS
ncbi:hypothetical protein C8A03DRAFT_45683 [Achaetomium macrosporum]|uniref:G1/S-specific cyclin pas1 n=1 Tax=Achaetomium macrosporum TaxID=79813 RepID=A0AAN7C6U5_9PEZI|nr:hypothetical protein C8A03DRAFT_45683 [Achaetomium macrosporum]